MILLSCGILFYIELNNDLDRNNLWRDAQAVANRLQISLSDNSEAFIWNFNMIKKEMDNFGDFCLFFDIYINYDDNSSDGIIEDLQRYAAKNDYSRPTKDDYSRPLLFRFINELNNKLIEYNVIKYYILISEDEPEKIPIKTVRTEEFKNFLLHHYGWLTDEELKNWIYDVNIIFEIILEE